MFLEDKVSDLVQVCCKYRFLQHEIRNTSWEITIFLSLIFSNFIRFYSMRNFEFFSIMCGHTFKTSDVTIVLYVVCSEMQVNVVFNIVNAMTRFAFYCYFFIYLFLIVNLILYIVLFSFQWAKEKKMHKKDFKKLKRNKIK